MEPLKEHWHFALNAGIHFLERLVYEFHLLAQESEKKGHAYVRVPEPHKLLQLIDGFLEERSFLGGGTIGNLERMRIAVEQELVVIFEQGLRQAEDEWNNASEQKLKNMAALDFDEFRVLGKNFASLLDLSLSGHAWFVEAFARQWTEKRIAYRINNF
jgi:hypothetical protein